tara:strand:- start:1538 stop:1786 length:249 start_codon:yes stop_codon:yes gene_type:complete
MKRIKETVLSILDSVIEVFHVFGFILVLICWMVLGLLWTYSVRFYYKFKKRSKKLFVKLTAKVLKLYDKLLTFNEKWFIIKK